MTPRSAASASVLARVTSPRRRVAVAAVALAAVVPLAGCAAGYKAETSRERPTIDGVGGAIGTLTIRDAYVGGPVQQGGTSPLLLAVFNNGTEDDQLVNVTSGEASAGSVPTNAAVPSGGQQIYTPGSQTPRLTGLTVAARPGDIVPITLTFQRAGQLTMQVPVVELPTEQLAGPAQPQPAVAPTTTAPASPTTAPSSAAPSSAAASAAAPSAASPTPSAG